MFLRQCFSLLSQKPFILIMVLIMACTCMPLAAGTPTPETPEPTATASLAPLAVSNLQDVQLATIQILTEGTFLAPLQWGGQTSFGAGSGFIIDPSGIAVTNNHVVSGAAFIKWRQEGETSLHTAKLLGVSECSDLAVIQLEEGTDYHYLQTYSGDIKVAMDIYTAGFPLGDPEYTMTRGVVSKAKANGDTSWTSVESVIEHDATINPGNSGGPLIDPQGKLVGINYASDKSTSQYYAINIQEALPIIDTLKTGKDVDSIGVNGTALHFTDVSGIWVSAIRSGSPADVARVLPGDYIYSLENIPLAQSGTMEEYCNVIRSKKPGDQIAISLLRLANGSFQSLSGRLTLKGE